MKIRGQIYSQEASSLLRDISMYQVLREKQLLGLYPGKEKAVKSLLSYMVKQGRITQEDDYYCAGPGCMERLDRSLLAAVWVLIDFIDRVEFHAVGDFPAKLIFFADDKVYEIVHAEQGRENLLTHLMSQKGEDFSRFIVLVDTPEQIEELNLPVVCGYCTVSQDGEVQYYQKE